MRAILQRVKNASVTVNSEIISQIGPGIMCLIGIGVSDTKEDADWILKKLLNIRIFTNQETGKSWDKSVTQMNYDVLLVSQFTLLSTLKGNKPDFHLAMETEKSKQFYSEFVDDVKKSYNVAKVKDGKFGAMMDVQLVNDGPVTLEFDSKNK